MRKVLTSWGPGRYDAELSHDGKATRPDVKPAATVMSAAFGLAGVMRHCTVGMANAHLCGTSRPCSSRSNGGGHGSSTSPGSSVR